MDENEEEEQLILGRFKKIRFILREDRSDKYLMRDVFGGERVEIKVQRVGEPKPTVLHEAGFLQQMQGYPGFPLMIWSGNFSSKQLALITERLGPSLSQLLPFGRTHFSLATALLIGQQLIRLLQILHDKHAVLGNFSLQNFKISAKAVDKITVSSLYACRRYRSSRTLKHYKVKQVDCGQFINYFMSFNSLANMSTSRRDDLESFFFFMVFIIKGKLPWSHVPLSLKNIAKTQQKIYTIMEPLFANQNSQVKDQLLEGMPSEFAQILEHICALKFQERPNYSLVRMKLRKMLLIIEKDSEPRFEWISTLSKLKYESPKEIQLYNYADIKTLKRYYLPQQVKIELDSIDNGIGQYKSNGSPRKGKLKKGTCEVM